MAAEPRPSRALRQTENQASNDLANDWTTGGVLPVPGLGGHTLGGHLSMTPLSTLNPISARTKDAHAITASKPWGLLSPIR